MFASLFFSLLNADLLFFKGNVKRANGKNQGCCMPPLPPDVLVVVMNFPDERKDLWAGNYSSFRLTGLENRKF
jgi:hypothetical protein